LLENAIRHAPPGTTVGVTARPVDGTIEVEIRDEGPGIAPDERQRIFDPFFRGAAVRAANHPGAGLGLTIARDIARLHGGEITLASVDTLPGTRFIVRLPMKGAPPAELSTDSSPPVARGHGGAR
jgi:signal transduction histidine kinase